MLESVGVIVKIRNHWNDSFLTFDESIGGERKILSSILDPKLHQEWKVIPGMKQKNVFYWVIYDFKYIVVM